MSLEQYLHIVRKYAVLSRRMNISFAEQVDAMTEIFVASEILNTTPQAMDEAVIRKMAAREYPDQFRNFPVWPPR